MTIKLTAEHVRMAIKAFNNSNWITVTRCCPVFQALNDANVPVISVSYCHWHVANQLPHPLPELIKYITVKSPDNWEEIQPCEFEIDWDPQPSR